MPTSPSFRKSLGHPSVSRLLPAPKNTQNQASHSPTTLTGTTSRLPTHRTGSATIAATQLQVCLASTFRQPKQDAYTIHGNRGTWVLKIRVSLDIKEGLDWNPGYESRCPSLWLCFQAIPQDSRLMSHDSDGAFIFIAGLAENAHETHLMPCCNRSFRIGVVCPTQSCHAIWRSRIGRSLCFHVLLCKENMMTLNCQTHQRKIHILQAPNDRQRPRP